MKYQFVKEVQVPAISEVKSYIRPGKVMDITLDCIKTKVKCINANPFTLILDAVVSSTQPPRTYIINMKDEKTLCITPSSQSETSFKGIKSDELGFYISEMKNTTEIQQVPVTVDDYISSGKYTKYVAHVAVDGSLTLVDNNGTSSFLSIKDAGANAYGIKVRIVA